MGEIRRIGRTIHRVEQKAFKALEVADRAYVLEQGRIVKEGRACDIEEDPSVRAAYLGAKSSGGGSA